MAPSANLPLLLLLGALASATRAGDAGHGATTPIVPVVRDICGMLERELQGRMSPFLR